MSQNESIFEIYIATMLVNMLGGVSKDAQILKDFSIYGLYDPVKLVHGGEVFGLNLLFIGIIVMLFTASVLAFKRKRLIL